MSKSDKRPPMSKAGRLSLWPAGSPKASLSARACLGLPRAPASLGQSAAWAALAGHIGACFQPRCLRTARHPRASGTAESLQRGRGSRLSHRRSAAAATGQATGPVTAQFSTLNEMPPVTQLMSSHGRSGPCFESHLPAPYFLLSPPYSICTRPAPSHICVRFIGI